MSIVRERQAKCNHTQLYNPVEYYDGIEWTCKQCGKERIYVNVEDGEWVLMKNPEHGEEVDEAGRPMTDWGGRHV